MDKFPTKKDLAYWILILVISNVLIFTVKLGDNTNVVDYMGFAGTIMSLILAIIAIIYSFYQNSTYVNSTQKLESSADKIESITEDLSQLKEFKELAEEFNYNAHSITNRIDGLREVVSTLEYGIDDVHQSVKDTQSEINFMLQSQSLTQNDKELVQFEYTNEYFKDVVNNMSQGTLVLTSWVRECFLLNIPFEQADVGRWMVENVFEERFDKDNQDEYVNTLKNYSLVNLGVCIAYGQLGFFIIENNEVVSFNSILLNALEEFEDKIKQDKIDRYQLLLQLKEFLKEKSNNN